MEFRPGRKKNLIPVLVLAALAAGCRTAAEAPKEMRGIDIALCQIFCLDGDREGNFARIEGALKEAKSNGAEIACFPECALLGWVNPDAHRRARPIPGDDSERLCRLAEKYGIFICIGLAEKDGDALYDSAVLIDDRGGILLKHRKMNILTELMRPPYTPGEGVKTAATRFGQVGLLICADTFKQEILESMKALEPDLVLVPYGWAAPEDRWPDHGESLSEVIGGAARVIGAPVIGTDLVGAITHGPWTGHVYGGQSAAADREGRILAVARDRDRDVLRVRVELDE